MKKPNLFIVGFAKSGTSSLYQQLIRHPKVSGGTTKEPHIYASEERFHNRFNPMERFSFDRIYPENNRFVLDASTSTIVAPQALERILEDTPDAKFIIIARDPVDRIFSHYKWLQSKGSKLLPLKKELSQERGDTWDFSKNENGRFKFFWLNSMYGTHLEKLTSLVPQYAYHFMFYEDFITSLKIEMQKVFSFLNIEDIAVEEIKANPTEPGVAVPNKIRALSRLLPTKLRKNVKQRLANIQHHKPRIEDIQVLIPELNDEMDKLKKIGLRTDKWKSTQKILSAHK
jgi:hypothetical protein